MKQVIEAVLKTIDGAQEAALVTPVSREGSLPTGRLARMLVRPDGSTVGTVGGGRMEAEAREMALSVIGQKPKRVDFELSAQDALADGLLCGGRASFYLESISALTPAAAFRAMCQFSAEGFAAVEAVRLDSAQRLVVRVDGSVAGFLGSGLDKQVVASARQAIEEDRSEVLTLSGAEGEVEVFVNGLVPQPTVYIFGGGHVGLALARIAPTAGFGVVVTDDRVEFANPSRFPMADRVRQHPFGRAFEGVDIDGASYIVVMTRGHKWDREVIEQALRTRPAYIGMIGSRRKIGLTWEVLKSRGFSQEELERVHAPIGLDIGGDTPGEIAVSILAELIQVRRKTKAA